MAISTSAKSVRVERQKRVARLILDRPPYNILTRDVLARLREAMAGLARERELCVLLLSAAGEHFSAGADVAEHLPPEHEALIPEFLDTVRVLAEFPAPTVAVVRGRCVGGGFELAQAADLIVAARTARFGQPEIGLGVFPPAACARLPQVVGAAAARELLFTGDLITARQARRLGLVCSVVEDGRLDEAAEALARRIARHSPAALRLTKRAVGRAEEGWTAAMAEAGRLYVDELMSTADAVEGLRAFVEKRTPRWSGR